LELLGFCKRDVRLPQVPVSEATYNALKKEMEALALKRNG
jgi:dihydrodipicolinate synthase/N-acetylneuraminate lyase